MTPSRLAVTLRQIAQKIDNSKRPDKGLVSAELHRVLAGMEHNDDVEITFTGTLYTRNEPRWLSFAKGFITIDGVKHSLKSSTRGDPGITQILFDDKYLSKTDELYKQIDIYLDDLWLKVNPYGEDRDEVVENGEVTKVTHIERDNDGKFIRRV